MKLCSCVCHHTVARNLHLEIFQQRFKRFVPSLDSFTIPLLLHALFSFDETYYLQAYLKMSESDNPPTKQDADLRPGLTPLRLRSNSTRFALPDEGSTSPGPGSVPRLRFGSIVQHVMSAESTTNLSLSPDSISPRSASGSQSPRPGSRAGGGTDLARVAMVAAARARSRSVGAHAFESPGSFDSSMVSPLTLTPLTPPSGQVSPYWAKFATAVRQRSMSIESVNADSPSPSPPPGPAPRSPSLPAMDFSPPGARRQRSMSVLVHRRSTLSLRHPEVCVFQLFFL